MENYVLGCSLDNALDLRRKALEYLDTVGNRKKLVEAVNIFLRTLERWIRRRGGNCLPAKQRKSSPSKVDDRQLRLFVREHPDAYLREITEKFETTLKNPYYKRDETKREEFINELAKIAKSDRVCFDESGINKCLRRECAGVPRGTQVYGAISRMRHTRESFIAAQKEEQVLAPFCYRGTCDTVLFNMWVKDFFLPELKPGQVVMIDNAAFHKSQETKKLIETAGCRVLFLPPYSPDLNPIEKGEQLVDAIDSVFLGLSIHKRHL